MKTLYLIASHANPRQVERLARTLTQGGDGDVLIHHDAKSQEIPDVSEIPRAMLYPSPIEVSWGDFSQVQLFVQVIDWALENLSFDWLVFLSGQDYPIRPIKAIESDLARSKADVYLTGHAKGEHPIWPLSEASDRYHYRYYTLPKFPYAYKVPRLVDWLQGMGNRMNKNTSLFRYRWMPYGLPGRVGIRVITPFKGKIACYAGPQWGYFSRASLEYLRQFIKRNPGFLKHFKRTLMPDESCVLSALYSGSQEGLLKIDTDNRRYVHWKNEMTDASPQTIVSSDYDKMLASGKDFARKFNTQIDALILDKIDREIHRVTPTEVAT